MAHTTKWRLQSRWGRYRETVTGGGVLATYGFRKQEYHRRVLVSYLRWINTNQHAGE